MVGSDEAAEFAQGLSSGGAAPGAGIARSMSQLARELQAEPDEQAMRQRITQAALSEIDGATWAGITLVEGKHLHTVAQTAQLVREIDQVQYRTGEGPCVRSLREHATVRSNDLRAETRWPKFAQAAIQHGVLSVLAFQLYVEGDNLGALNLYADHAQAFGEDESVGLLFASHAAIALKGARVEHHLRRALEHRDIIGQAKGILMERHKINAQQAFDMLVYASQHTHRKLHELADHIAATGELPTASD
jgi:GAF domain-containing protein